MLKTLLIATLIYVVSAIAFTIYFTLVGMKGAGAVTARVLLAIFVWVAPVGFSSNRALSGL
jgi:hypothetical protein